MGRLVDTGAAGAYAWCYGDYDARLFGRPPLATAVRERTVRACARRRDVRSRPPACSANSESDARPENWFVGRVPPVLDVSADEYYRAPGMHFDRLYAKWLSMVDVIAPLERLSTNPLIRPSQIGFVRASGSFNPGAGVDHASGRVVLLVRVFEEDTRRSCLALAISSDGHSIDEILDRPAVAREAPYEEWGVEDARVTYLADEGRYAITYTGYSSAGPRVCLITTDDLLAPATYQRHGPRLAGDNKNCVIFPRKVAGQYVILHRPMPRIVCIRVDSLEAEWPAHGVDLMGPQAGTWRSSRVGAGAPPILTRLGWLLAVSWRDNDRGRQRVLHGVVRPRLEKSRDRPLRVGHTRARAGRSVRD